MAKKKLSPEEKEEMKQAFEEQQKRREEELQFQKEHFPHGVLKIVSEEEEKAFQKAVQDGDIITGKPAEVILRKDVSHAIEVYKLKKKASRKGQRDRGFSEKEIAFCDWVKEYNIDLNESLDIIHDKLEQAYIAKQIRENISRSKLAEYLGKYRAKKD